MKTLGNQGIFMACDRPSGEQSTRAPLKGAPRDRAPWATPSFVRIDARAAESGTNTGGDLNSQS
jgi:hypothetical protein